MQNKGTNLTVETVNAYSNDIFSYFVNTVKNHGIFEIHWFVGYVQTECKYDRWGGLHKKVVLH